MNILIKLMSVISLVLAPLFVEYGLNLFLISKRGRQANG